MRDTLCAYYTDSEDITSYMVKAIGIEDGNVILEPSAGEGTFIDQILKSEQGKHLHIDALDISDDALNVLEAKYSNNPFVTVRKTDTLLDGELDSYSISQLWIKQTDTLFDQQLDLFTSLGGHYDRVIGNPPYGAWQEPERRNLLKKKYAGHYVKETYSLFLLRCLSVLKNGGKLSFIIPDTFLFLNMHSKLRQILLTKTKISEILIFPSHFFPGVSFGYSNLSIITLERCNTKDALCNDIRIIKGFNNPSEFSLVSNGQVPDYLQIFKLNQKSVFECPQHRFVIADEHDIDSIYDAERTLGDVANIVTGFYTGDNVRFIKTLNRDVKGSKKYEVVDKDKIYSCRNLKGISNVSEGYIPYIKSAPVNRYIGDGDEWFVRWDAETIDFYNKNKKSRFQNSDYYFKTGIGIPMVKANTIRAFLMKDRVFDQSIVGIFPKDLSKLNYMLALMNSSAINKILHLINPTANNSSNYVKLIPYKEPSDQQMNAISKRVQQILSDECTQELRTQLHKEIDTMVSSIYEI